jgi:fido (protein-threonine AMPylation protein)
VAVGTLPLTLLGIGAASWREVKGSQQLLRDQNALGALGISEADRARVAQLAGEGRMDEAHTALQEAMRNRNPDTARQFLEQAGAKTDRAAAAFEQRMRKAGLTLSQDGSEYVITNSTGAKARFSSAEEALAHLGSAAHSEKQNRTGNSSTAKVIADEALIYTPAHVERAELDQDATLTKEERTVGVHTEMKREIQQNKCLPNIRTEEDFRRASEIGFRSATEYLASDQKSFSNWTVDDLSNLHRLYFGYLYPHAGQFRNPGDLAAFNGRVGADGKNIQPELELMLEQTRKLSRSLPPIESPQGLTERLSLIAFVHARLTLVHPFRDGNGRWARLIVSNLEKQLLPQTGKIYSVPKPIYIHALKALPKDIGPLMAYHAERNGLRPSTLKPVDPPFPVQVTHRD